MAVSAIDTCSISAGPVLDYCGKFHRISGTSRRFLIVLSLRDSINYLQSLILIVLILIKLYQEYKLFHGNFQQPTLICVEM